MQRQNTADRINADFQMEESRKQFQEEMETRRQNFEVAKLQAQWLHQYSLQKDNQAFQAEEARKNFERNVQLANLNHENAMKLQAFREHWENLRLHKRQEFERSLFEERKKHEWQLKQYDRETQIIMAAVSLQNTLRSTEYSRLLDVHPLITQSTPTLDFYKQYRNGSKPVPLLIIISPPALEFEQFPHAAQGFSRLELRLTDELRDFLSANYPLQSQERPTKFLGGAYKTKRIHSEAAIEILYWTHKSVPTRVLESKVDGDTIRLYLGRWDVMEEIYHYKKLMSIPWKEVLYPLARENARLWKEERNRLLEEERTPKEIEEEGGDDEYNLRIWEAEERDKRRGRNKLRDYKVNDNEYTQELADFLSFCHSVLAGLAVDQYYLFNYNVRPKLPELLPGLLQKVPIDNLKQQLVEIVISTYQGHYQALKILQPDCIPELALDLAQSLTHLDDKSWTRGQLNYAIQSWLELRGVTQPDNAVSPRQGSSELTDILLEILESVLVPADIQYVDRLNQGLAALGDNHRLSVINTCHNRGMSHYQQGEYQAAIADFDQSIQLDSNWAEAYYNRGLAYAKLRQYQKAIADYTQALRINDSWADAYNNRGNAYYKLGNHEDALIDYNQALIIKPDWAEVVRNQDIVQGVLEELNRMKIGEFKYRDIKNIQAIIEDIPKQCLPVTIVTGFLGSGKTTLINQILRLRQDLKFAVLVGEYGEVHIDSQNLVVYETYKSELSDVWRSIHDDTYTAELAELVYQVLEREDRADHLIVETSGLADPLPVALTFLGTELRDLTRLDSLITVVDSVN